MEDRDLELQLQLRKMMLNKEKSEVLERIKKNEREIEKIDSVKSNLIEKLAASNKVPYENWQNLI